MSPRRLEVFQDAERDLDELFDYSESTWGHQQAVAYSLSIADALVRLL